VNVGDPNGSLQGENRRSSVKVSESRRPLGSQMNRSTDETSNDGGGKDSG
jgi:hypothetical protein